jgi:hypothetical protein
MDRQPVSLLWHLLIERAELKQMITYGEAAVKVGGIARGMGAFLRPIQTYCRDVGLPNLSVLVVRAADRKQSAGFVGDPEREKQRVFAYDWSKVPDPFHRGS